MSSVKKTAFIILFTWIFFAGQAQIIATLEVVLDKDATGMEIPVSTSLDDITYLPDSIISLYEITRSGRSAVPFQIEAGFPRILHWIVFPSGNKPGEKHTYELVQGEACLFRIQCPP
jgi:hypothetical protein